MRRVLVILNPASGDGRGERLRSRLLCALQTAALPFELAETSRAGHAAELAKQARGDGVAVVVAAGGDGTVNEVINGLAQATPAGQTVGQLGILPIGSANDLAAMAGCPLNLEVGVQAIAAGATRRIDLGNINLWEDAREHHHFFGNNVGVGFEAAVTLESYKIKWLRGTPLYTLAALRALRTCQAPLMHVTWETSAGEVHQLSQATMLVSIGNSRRTGGGFYLNPDAQLDDGQLDFGIAAAASQWRIVSLLLKALRGAHTSDPLLTMARCRHMEIISSAPVPVHVDGEVLSRAATRIEIGLEPARLELIVSPVARQGDGVMGR